MQESRIIQPIVFMSGQDVLDAPGHPADQEHPEPDFATYVRKTQAAPRFTESQLAFRQHVNGEALMPEGEVAPTPIAVPETDTVIETSTVVFTAPASDVPD